jgi:hypothetical protein
MALIKMCVYYTYTSDSNEKQKGGLPIPQPPRKTHKYRWLLPPPSSYEYFAELEPYFKEVATKKQSLWTRPRNPKPLQNL